MSVPAKAGDGGARPPPFTAKRRGKKGTGKVEKEKEEEKKEEAEDAELAMAKAAYKRYQQRVNDYALKTAGISRQYQRCVLSGCRCNYQLLGILLRQMEMSCCS